VQVTAVRLLSVLAIADDGPGAARRKRAAGQGRCAAHTLYGPEQNHHESTISRLLAGAEVSGARRAASVTSCWCRPRHAPGPVVVRGYDDRHELTGIPSRRVNSAGGAVPDAPIRPRRARHVRRSSILRMVTLSPESSTTPLPSCAVA